MRFVLLILFCAVILTACADSQNVPVSDNSAPVDLNNFAGADALASATAAMRTSVAVRATVTAAAENRTATWTAATAIAAGTQQADIRQATATANAIWARQQELSVNATEDALTAQREQTKQASAMLATTQVMEFASTRAAVAGLATQTTVAATATSQAEEMQSAHEKQEATATAQAVQIAIAQAQLDSARYQAWSEFFDSLMKIVIGIGTIAALLVLLVQGARYLDARAARQGLIETRTGTVLLARVGGQYVAQLIETVSRELAPGDDFAISQLPILQDEVQNVLKVTTARGERFIAKSDPLEEAREQQRKLAMRLMRESLRYYSSLGGNSREINRIASFRDLKWSSETWTRAVAILKPYVIARQGRNGGTYCAEQFPTLVQLYAAIGERRIVLGEGQAPSPTANALAA